METCPQRELQSHGVLGAPAPSAARELQSHWGSSSHSPTEAINPRGKEAERQGQEDNKNLAKTRLYEVQKMKKMVQMGLDDG